LYFIGIIAESNKPFIDEINCFLLGLEMKIGRLNFVLFEIFMSLDREFD
jgi:hypothetical protein